jgi:hypothetical protein
MGWVDFGGAWHWNVDEPTLRRIHEKLSKLEGMTWKELRGSDHKPIPVATLCSAAQKRLTKIKRDDYEQVYELRLGAKQRVWGIREAHVFYLLWWDPNHLVCPSER